jgi:uncharacterized protein YbcC (UPF0753/DUF2309 family)
VHEPLRLNVFLEADPDAIQTILAKHAGIRELVENGWVHLFVMDASATKFWRHCAKEFVELNE